MVIAVTVRNNRGGLSSHLRAFTNVVIIIESEVVNNCGKTFGQRLTRPIARSVRSNFHERIYGPGSDTAAIRDVRLIRHARHGARLSQLSANIRKLAYRCARATRERVYWNARFYGHSDGSRAPGCDPIL